MKSFKSFVLENQKLGWRKRKLYYPPMSDPNNPDELNPDWRGTDSARRAIQTYGYGSPEHLRVAKMSGLQLRRDRLQDLAAKNPNNPKLKKRAEQAHAEFWKALAGMPERSTGYVKKAKNE